MEGVILKDIASFFNQSYNMYMFTPSFMHLACTWNTVLNLLCTVKPLVILLCYEVFTLFRESTDLGQSCQ